MKAIITIVLESKDEEVYNEILEFKDKINSGEFQREIRKNSNIKVTATCNIIKPCSSI